MVISAGIRGTTRIVIATVAYLLMLVVMTYNVGLCVATVLGLGLGSAVFGGFARRVNVKAGISDANVELCC